MDAVGDSGWMQLDKAMASKPAAPVSIGYKILQAREKITIFTDYIIDDEDGSLNSRQRHNYTRCLGARSYGDYIYKMKYLI